VERYGVPATGVLDMGDFAGAVLRYVARHPIERLTLAGGFAKLSKLAAGHLDLHSGRSRVDLERLSTGVRELGGAERVAADVRSANTALHALELARAGGVDLAGWVAGGAHGVARQVLSAAPVELDVLVVDREGRILAQSSAAATPAPR
jgi:cobalt-precorrin-5B (C1)-methyltransferase